MSHPVPAAAQSWWRRVLAFEPVAVQAVVRAVFVLVGATGLAVPEVVEVRILATVVAFYALVEVVTTLLTRARVTPDAAVVERATTDVDSLPVVVAGPANDVIPAGEVVRVHGVPRLADDEHDDEPGGGLDPYPYPRGF